MRRTILLALLAASAHAQPAPSTAYVGGQWFDGERFVACDTTWASGSVFVDGPLAGPVRVVRLGGRYVVPPFGDAHLHALDDPEALASQDSLLVSRGVFYVLNPHVPTSDREAVRGTETTVDVAYAVAGITAPGAHPATIYEARALGLQPWDAWGPRGGEIRAGRSRDGDAYRLAATVANVDTVWPAVLASGTDLVKVFLDHSDEWAGGVPEQPRGLAPNVVAEITRRAHAAGLRVVAHVVTASDLEAALDAGVDMLAHAPGHSLNDRDPVAAEGGAYVIGEALMQRLAASGIPVTPTLARGPAMVRYIPEAYRPSASIVDTVRAFHARLLRHFARAGVPVAIGADSGDLWAWDEVAYAVETGGLTPAEAIQAWAVATPRTVFPDRALGRLAAGYEASFLALACDPTANWSCTAQITPPGKAGPRPRPAADGRPLAPSRRRDVHGCPGEHRRLAPARVEGARRRRLLDGRGGAPRGARRCSRLPPPVRLPSAR